MTNMMKIKRKSLSLVLLCLFISGIVISCTQQAGSSNALGRTAEEREAASVDVDLSALSTTVLSVEVMNIIANADDFAGQTIRVRGMYYVFIPGDSDTVYHYIITKDGDACCQEGFEFRWKGNHSFPGDYPPLQTTIELDGVLTVAREDDRRVLYLSVEDIWY